MMELIVVIVVAYLVTFGFWYLLYGGISHITQDQLISHLQECEVKSDIYGKDWLYHKRGGEIFHSCGRFLPMFPKYNFLFTIDGIGGGELIPNKFNYLIENKLNEA